MYGGGNDNGCGPCSTNCDRLRRADYQASCANEIARNGNEGIVGTQGAISFGNFQIALLIYLPIKRRDFS